MATTGRPRAFDVEQALDKALKVFWRQGYEGASLSDLTRAMGINRPALYSAFGSKKDLFLRAVDRYYAVDAVHTFEALREPTALQVTEEYLRRSVEQLTHPDRPLGCFVLRGAFTCSPENRDIENHMTTLRRKAESDLRERYEKAQEEGDRSAGEDNASLARMVLIFRHGLAVLACDGTARAELDESVDRFLAGLPSAHRTAQRAG